MRRLFVLIILFLSALNNAFAESCWQSAAQRYGIDESLLRAIAYTESAMNPQAINRNANGSVDVGLMQINSWWFPHLAKMGIQSGNLWEPCTSIHVGAWVLAGYVEQFGYSWRAVGAYNAGPGQSTAHEQRRINYAQRVYHNLANNNHHLSDGVRVYAETKQ